MRVPTTRETVDAVLRGDGPVMDQWVEWAFRSSRNGKGATRELLTWIHARWQADARLLAGILRVVEDNTEIAALLENTPHGDRT